MFSLENSRTAKRIPPAQATTTALRDPTRHHPNTDAVTVCMVSNVQVIRLILGNSPSVWSHMLERGRQMMETNPLWTSIPKNGSGSGLVIWTENYDRTIYIYTRCHLQEYSQWHDMIHTVECREHYLSRTLFNGCLACLFRIQLRVQTKQGA